VYCPNAEAGLAVCEETYYPSQFNYINYMASSGGLSVPESDQRQSYYAMSGIPDLYFDGYQHLVGAGSDAVDGHLYFPIITNHWTNTTPVSVRVTDFSFTPGNAYANIQVEIIGGNLASIANTYIRVAVIESELTYGGSTYDHVLRDMLPSATGTPLTVQTAGQIQTVSLPFTMGAWAVPNLQIIAWVQRDSDKFIYNSGNSRMVPFAAGVEIAGVQQQITTGAPLAFGSTTITNVGLEPDTYDITLDTSALPAGWNAHFTHNGVDGTSLTIPVASMASANLFVTINAPTHNYGHVTLNVVSHGTQANVAAIEFIAVPGNRQVLLVADDGAAAYAETFVLPSLLADSRTVTVWDRAFSTVDGATLNAFDAVIWVCGSENKGLEAPDRAAIDPYLAAGGRMILTGQDLAADLAYEGGTVYQWFKAKTHCKYMSGNAANWDITGTAGDPIGDGLSFAITGGDGANNQTDPDRIELNDTIAQAVFRYGTGSLAGGRVEVDGYKILTLAFGLEAISTQAARDAVLSNSLEWLIGPPVTTPVQDAPRVLTLAQNTPNPFNPLTKIAFALDQSGPVRLAVYDVQGRLVRTLVNAPLAAGEHTLVWDGRDDANQQAASGMYVYRLTANDQTLTRKMTLVK
jgi:hypothetical protein